MNDMDNDKLYLIGSTLFIAGCTLMSVAFILYMETQ